MESHKLLPQTEAAQVVRTDFDHEEVWKFICDLIRRPVVIGKTTCLAHVEFVSIPDFRNLTTGELLERLPKQYAQSFLFVVDKAATQAPEFPILVVDLYDDPGRTFRTIYSEIHGIEANLSISNMDFFEIADSVDSDGVFRGFHN